VASMSVTFEKVCAKVLGDVTPSLKEKKHILRLAEELMKKLQIASEEAHVEADVRVEGSVAKNTWLSKEPDIDIFMRLPTAMPREAFGTTGLKIARKATKGCKQIERFAEHPYLEAIVDSVRVNIVPCYKVEKGEWKSATDRTPFHTDYVKPRLNEESCGQIRLLKKFMKGIGVYGAEIKVGGFSGYLCELLTLNYGSFEKVLKSFEEWKGKRIIDYENHYQGRENEIGKIFEESLVIVDPIDKGRNVAAAVRKGRLDEFIAASRAFTKEPGLEFFYPQDRKTINSGQLAKTLKTRGSALVFFKFGKLKAVPDILWGQLYRSQKALRTMLKQHDFNVIRDSAWSDEENISVMIFELEQQILSPFKKHLGPPIEKRIECERFLRKHLRASQTVSGPRIEGGRWVVETKRKHNDVVKLVNEKLRGRGRQRLSLPDLLAKSVRKDFEVLVNEECVKLYSSSPEFAKFLTEFLDGKPRWLT
jgi:tRNA nucleotidyltransferase (CCA-adding enzyme)